MGYWEFEGHDSYSKKRRKKYLYWVACLVFWAVVVMVLLPRHRGRVVRDPSRVERVTFQPSCEGVLGSDSSRARVRLVSVAPDDGITGLRAVLQLEVCNPNETDLALPGLRVRYSPSGQAATPFSWELGARQIGSGYCDDYTVESLPLGELVRFRSGDGEIRVEGLDSSLVFTLPDCRPPTPRPTKKPPPPTPTKAPPPTLTPVVMPTLLPEADLTSGRTFQTSGVINEIDCRDLGTDVFTARTDGLILLSLEKRSGTVEIDTRAVIGSLPPEMLEYGWGGHLKTVRRFLGRPVYIALVNETETVYLFPVLSSKKSGSQRYFVDTVETIPTFDPGYRTKALKIPIRNGEKLRFQHFAIPVHRKDRICMDTTWVRYRLVLAPPVSTKAAPRTPPVTIPGCADDSEEPNDSYTVARPLPAGSHEMRLCPKYKKRELTKLLSLHVEDVDWFTLNVPEDKILVVNAAFDGKAGNIDLRLYDTTPQGANAMRHSLTLTGSETVITPRGPGAYYLAVCLTAQPDPPSPDGVTYILNISEQRPR